MLYSFVVMKTNIASMSMCFVLSSVYVFCAVLCLCVLCCPLSMCFVLSSVYVFCAERLRHIPIEFQALSWDKPNMRMG
jgi:uncharacterized membrane protein (DUF485 family)